MMTFFQKLFSVGGILLKYLMKTKMEKPPPPPMYGAPQNYDTVGYSYGPPEHESSNQVGYPGTDVASSFDWLLNKHVK